MPSSAELFHLQKRLDQPQQVVAVQLCQHVVAAQDLPHVGQLGVLQHGAKHLCAPHIGACRAAVPQHQNCLIHVMLVHGAEHLCIADAGTCRAAAAEHQKIGTGTMRACQPRPSEVLPAHFKEVSPDSSCSTVWA